MLRRVEVSAVRDEAAKDEGGIMSVVVRLTLAAEVWGEAVVLSVVPGLILAT